MKYKLGFIGVGNMGGALASAACESAGRENVVVMNRSPEKARALGERLGCAVLDSAYEVAKSAEFVVLGVKPAQIAPLVRELVPVLSEKSVLVSMAAGITTAAVSESAGGKCAVVRILPNTPCALGMGMVLVSPGAGANSEAREFSSLCAAAGRFSEIPEELMDAGCAASGCSPAFAYMFIDAVARGAESAGVPYNDALVMAAQAVLGAAAMVLKGEKSPKTLCENVCSPGGSTIEGVSLLKNEGFENTVRRAVLASYNRNRELGK